MKSQFDIAEPHLDDSTKILVSKLDHDLQAHISDTVERFKQLEISEYLIKRPKNLVQKMLEVKDANFEME